MEGFFLKKSKLLLSVLVLTSIFIVMAGCGGGGGTIPVQNLPGTLIVSEIGGSYYSNSAFWVEIYNNSSEDAQLSNYILRSKCISTADFTSTSASKEFTLPALIIHPGAYVILRSEINSGFQSVGNLVYIKDDANNLVPYWYVNGFIELIKAGQTADFVRFGTDATAPTTSSAWVGGRSAPALPSGYGYCIARDGSETDTHSATDWVARDFATPGGPNDVTSNVDADHDGIPDSCEQPGSTFAGLPLYDWGARPGQKDIFIHVDYMDSPDPGVIPRKEALDKVRDAFAEATVHEKYVIHFDVGDLYSASANDPANYNLDGRSHRVPFANGVSIPPLSSGVANLYTYKNTYMPLAKRQVFHYLLMAYTQQANGSSGSSGVAELNGNDLIVTLGNWGLTNTSSASLNELINFQAGTIMHEFGHNLGLRHGGDEDTNYKPNYYSIMNYSYQLYGLPVIGDHEGDRFYYIKGYTTYVPSGEASLVNGPLSSNMRIDYSNGKGGSITESSVSEDEGLRQTGSLGIDFNNNGVATDIISMDLNSDGTLSPLHDYDDWDNLDLFFIRNYYGDTSGSPNEKLKVWRDPVGDDRQTVIVESLMPKHLKRK